MNLRNARRQETQLTAAAIDEISLSVQGFLKEKKLPDREILRYALMIEEILLKSIDSGKENSFVRLACGMHFFQPCIVLEIDGEAENVFINRESRQTRFGTQILKNIGVSPEYRYSGGTNSYSFHLRKKRLNPFVTLILALSCAAATGFLGLMLPDNIRLGVLDNLFTPLHDTFLNMLGCIAGPMIFLAVAWGIYGIGDVTTLKLVGKKVLLSYTGTVAILIALIGAAAVPLFSLRFSTSLSSGSEISSIFSMLLDIIPRNIFSPFVDGNTLQVIFLGIVVGISLIFLGQRTDVVAQAIEQINYIVQFLIEFISRLVPFFIFIVIVRMIWSDTAAVLGGLGKLFAVFICAVLANTVCVLVITAVKNRVNPLLLAKKGISTFLIAITTASSAASFGTNVETCRKKYGIDETVTSFGIPLAMATFKPTTALNYVIMMFFFAETYQVEVSPAWIILALFIAIVLSMATPPIPGGALSAYTVMMMQLGIPTEALAIALACDAVFDFIDTGFDQFLLPFPLITQTGKLGLLDFETLRKK